MTRLNISLWVVPLLVATLLTGMAMAQNPTVQDPKAQEGKVLEGTLMDIDRNTRVLTLKAGDTEMQFSFTEQTELVVPDNNGTPPRITKGTKMRVHYTEHEKTNVATKIEILASAAAH